MISYTCFLRLCVSLKKSRNFFRICQKIGIDWHCSEAFLAHFGFRSDLLKQQRIEE